MQEIDQMRGPDAQSPNEEALAESHFASFDGPSPFAMVKKYAVDVLGINPIRESNLMWIAEQALTAPLPGGYRSLALQQSC